MDFCSVVSFCLPTVEGVIVSNKLSVIANLFLMRCHGFLIELFFCLEETPMYHSSHFILQPVLLHRGCYLQKKHNNKKKSVTVESFPLSACYDGMTVAMKLQFCILCTVTFYISE